MMGNTSLRVGAPYLFVLSVLLFLSLANTLFVMPVDKVAFIAFCACVTILLNQGKCFKKEMFAFVLVVVSFLISYAVSIDEFSLYGFDSFIILFYMFCFLMLLPFLEKNYLVVLGVFIAASFAYILFGIVSWVYSVLLGDVFFVQPLYGKQMADVYAALSFSTTQQVFGTITVLGLISVAWMERYSIGNRFFNLFFLAVSLLAVLFSLNRVWLLFIPFFLLFWGGRKVLYAFVFLGLLCIPVFVFYSDVMFSFGTVQSRFMMIDHLITFWLDQEFRHLLWGRPFYLGEYFFMHDRSFSYIESGPFYLLIKFGLVGVSLAGLFCSLWIIYLVRYSLFLAFFSFYYIFLVQFMTQEYLSISFWLYWVVIFCLYQMEKSRLALE